MKTLPQSPSLAETWHTLVKARANMLAIWEQASGRAYTFAQLQEAIERRVNRLSQYEVKQRGVVLYRPNGFDWLCDFMALRRLGAVVIPVDASYSQDRAREIAEAFDAYLYLSVNSLDVIAEKPRQWSDDDAIIKLTSGTSGEPKGLVFSDAEMIADAQSILVTMGIIDSDRNLCLHPLGHSYALGNIVYPLFMKGIPVVVGESAFPSAIGEAIRMGCATVFPTVPAVLVGLCKSRQESVSGLRLVISAAAPLKPELARTFLSEYGLTIHNFYGSSETGGIAYDRTGQAGLEGLSVGTPLEGVEVSLSADDRLMVTSYAVSHDGKQTPKDKPATWELADRARLRADGGIQLLGRTDRVVKIGGKRLDLESIETALSTRCPDTRFVLLAHQDALCLLVEGKAMSLADTLREFCPVRCVVKEVAAIPVNARGKVDRAKAIELLS